MTLYQWAARHGVSAEALADLRALLGTAEAQPGESGQSEAAVQAIARLEASKRGWRLWRNNCGAFQTEAGGWVRYGLCNESKRVNSALKSSDLIGIKPVLITPHHVGETIGQFAARECKPAGWKLTKGDKRGNAQMAFGTLVASLGGCFKFVTRGKDL